MSSTGAAAANFSLTAEPRLTIPFGGLGESRTLESWQRAIDGIDVLEAVREGKGDDIADNELEHAAGIARGHAIALSEEGSRAEKTDSWKTGLSEQAAQFRELTERVEALLKRS